MEKSKVLKFEIERKKLGISRRQYAAEIDVSVGKYGYYCRKYSNKSIQGQLSKSGDFIELTTIENETPVGSAILEVTITTPQGFTVDFKGNSGKEFILEFLRSSLEVNRV